MQRLGEQLLAHLGPVRVGRVEELDSKIERAAKKAPCRNRIRGVPPAAQPGQSHGPIADAAHAQVAADREAARRQDGRA